MRKGKEVRLVLRGGVGNQMFQYAAARALAYELNADLRLDDVSGFWRDSVYRRGYLLDRVGVKDPKLTRIERLPVLMHSMARRYTSRINREVTFQHYGCFLTEVPERMPGTFPILHLPECFYMDGYWQDPAYFRAWRDQISAGFLNGLDNKHPAMMPGPDDIAIGVRLYEEVPDTESKFSQSRGATLTALLCLIEILRENYGLKRLYVFSSLNRPKLISLGFSEACNFVTPDLGFSDPIETLQLLSHFRNHVVTSSTYYWWGAWLSERRYSGSGTIWSAAQMERPVIPENWRPVPSD